MFVSNISEYIEVSKYGRCVVDVIYIWYKSAVIRSFRGRKLPRTSYEVRSPDRLASGGVNIASFRLRGISERNFVAVVCSESDDRRV